MIGEFRAGARLFDPRRLPALDSGGVRDVILRIGRLAETLPEVAELDLNPVIAGPDGVVVVDARIRVAPAVTGDPALRALATWSRRRIGLGRAAGPGDCVVELGVTEAAHLGQHEVGGHLGCHRRPRAVRPPAPPG